MRLSVDSDDKGYDPRIGPECKVKALLNGVDVTNCCITADEQEGMVLCHAVGQDGNIILNDEQTETVKKIKFGNVKIIVPVDFWALRVKKNKEKTENEESS